MKSRTKIGMAVAMMALGTGSMMAADAPALKWDAFVDAYYRFNPDGIITPTTNVQSFDIRQNGFAVAGGRLGVKSGDAAKGPAGVVDLYFGDYATQLGGASEVRIGQAYISDVFGPVTVSLGHFDTHMGYEVIDAPSNWNYSRSLLFGAVPFSHVGLKVNYAVMDTLGLMAQLDDGNSNTAGDTLMPTTNATSGGAQISYSGVKGLSLIGNYYFAPQLTGGVYDNMHYFEFVSTYNLMEGLDIGGDYLYKTLIASSQTDAAGNVITTSSMLNPATGKLVAMSPKQQGYALYVNYAIPGVANLSVSPRFEAWYKPDDAGMDYADFDYTLTVKYAAGALKHWLEFRSDASSQAKFEAIPSDTKMRYSDWTLTYAATYQF